MAMQRRFFSAFCGAVLAAGLAVAPAQATKLFDAAKTGDVEQVTLLLKAGADPNERSPYDTPLHVAARFGSVKLVNALIEAGADVELAGYGGVRPLHAAVLAGQNRIASLLIALGARVDATDNLGRTPLLSLVSGEVQDLQSFKILLEAGADANLFDGPIRLHALDYAAMQGRAEVAEMLLSHGARVNANDNIYSKTPLHFAIAPCLADVPCLSDASGHQEVIEVLIAHGADVNAKDAQGLTPLQYAKRHVPGNGLLHLLLTNAGAK